MKLRLVTIAAAIFVTASPPADAQLLGDIDRTLKTATDTVDGATGALIDTTLTASEAALMSARRQRIELLRREHGEEIVLDRHEEPAIRGEALAVSPTDTALAAATAEGFEIARRKELAGLDVALVVLKAPEGVSTRRAIRRLQKLDPQGTYDYNHVYIGTGALAAAASAPAAPAPNDGASFGAARVGLIDGGVETAHVAFAGVKIMQQAFTGEGPVATAHGTAAASLIVGRDALFSGAAPGASLYAADVFGGEPTGGAADALAEAFAWLVSENVGVINASLVGPDNAGLAAVVKAVLAKGVVIVAAVGNDGPSAPPLFPASYEGVIGVTAVDERGKAIVEAARGPQVDFAAPGADMAAAGLDNGYYEVRGTSFASPIVAGLIAREAAHSARASEAPAALAAHAEDLGKKGRDKIYGDGLIGADLRVSPRAFAEAE